MMKSLVRSIFLYLRECRIYVVMIEIKGVYQRSLVGEYVSLLTTINVRTMMDNDPSIRSDSWLILVPEDDT